MPTPSKAEQEAEAAKRREQQEGLHLDQNDEIEAAEGSDPIEGENESGEPQRREPRQQEERRAPPERPMSASDKIREGISSRFRRPAKEEQPFSGDIHDPELIFGDAARVELDPEVEPEPVVQEQEAEPEPRKIKLKINGQDIELTEQQVIERAQKVSAADSYLDEAKTLLKEAKQIRRTRSGADVDQNQTDEQDRNNELEEPTEPSRGQNPGQRLQDAVEKIQFGEREEAAKVLGEIINETVDSRTDAVQLQRLMKNDFARSQKALQDFKTDNTELAKDPMVGAAMEATIYAIYREDIEKLGVVDADKIPTDPKSLADWHRFYRVHGMEVRQTADLLNEAKSRVSKRFAQPADTTRQRTEPQRAASRVDVNIDRTQRRASIPNNPSRSVSPRSDQQMRQPAVADRSSAIMAMRKARGQPVAS